MKYRCFVNYPQIEQQPTFELGRCFHDYGYIRSVF